MSRLETLAETHEYSIAGAPTVEIFDAGTATVEKLRFLEGGNR